MWCSYVNLCWSWAHFGNFGNLLGSFQKCLEISWQPFWTWWEHCGNIQIQKDQNCLEINFGTALKNKLELLDAKPWTRGSYKVRPVKPKIGGPRKFDPTLDPSSFYFLKIFTKPKTRGSSIFAKKKSLDLENTILLKIKN